MESEIENNKQLLLYEEVFNVASKVIMIVEEREKRNKIFQIILKLIQNILDCEAVNENSEKFRKIKVSNPNIQLIFQVNEVYFFFVNLGFEEKLIDNEMFLYLDKNKINAEKMEICLSYLNLLTLFESEDSEDNYYEKDKGYKYNDAQFKQEEPINNKVIYQKASLVDILKNSKDVRLGKTLLVPENYDKVAVPVSDRVQQPKKAPVVSNYVPPKQQFSVRNVNSNAPQKDLKTILKETAQVRIENAKKSEPKKEESKGWFLSLFSNEKNDVPVLRKPIIKEPENQNENQNRNEHPRFMSLRDLEYQNPVINTQDLIGKKCLELTNEFRIKHRLAPLEWEHTVWEVALTHSKNMGDKKVKFGHDGFRERIAKLRFYHTLAAENVFMCKGLAAVAEAAVNGWINSPGHRKNMLTFTTHCAIATYRNIYGEYFLTQIFVRKGY